MKRRVLKTGGVAEEEDAALTKLLHELKEQELERRRYNITFMWCMIGLLLCICGSYILMNEEVFGYLSGSLHEVKRRWTLTPFDLNFDDDRHYIDILNQWKSEWYEGVIIYDDYTFRLGGGDTKGVELPSFLHDGVTYALTASDPIHVPHNDTYNTIALDDLLHDLEHMQPAPSIYHRYICNALIFCGDIHSS